MVSIEVDKQTAMSLEFAAKIAGVSVGEVVSRMVRQASFTAPADPAPSAVAGSRTAKRVDRVQIHVDYEGHRTIAWFSPTTHRVDFEAGPLAGQSFKSPSGAARAVVSLLNPSVDSNRNGWIFWTVTDTNGPLQDLR